MGAMVGSRAGEDKLWAGFRLEQERYCLYGESVDAIVIPEELTDLPGMPAYFAGLLRYGGEMVPVIDMRILFHMPSIEQRVADFAQMKTAHMEWVESLRESVERRTAFEKPVDPHGCGFGIWYDHFRTDDYSLNHILTQIEGPHRRIHQCGARVNALLEEGEDAYGPFAEAEAIARKEMLPLLDRLIDAYRESNRGVIFVVHSGLKRVGLLVDEAMELIKREETVPCALPRSQPFLESAVLFGKAVQLCVNIDNLPFLGEDGIGQIEAGNSCGYA